MAKVRLTYTGARRKTGSPLVAIVTTRSRVAREGRERFLYDIRVLVADGQSRAIAALARMQTTREEIFDVQWVHPGCQASWPRAELLDLMRGGLDVCSDWRELLGSGTGEEVAA